MEVELQKPPAHLLQAIEEFRLEREQILKAHSTHYSYAKEMTRLHGLLRKYRHRWCFHDCDGNRTNQEPSARLSGWVDRYNILTDSPLFGWWCDGRGVELHDAYDVLS